MFLDEIGSMPALLQSRLLRVLQDGEVRRVGDNTPNYVNVRVIAATNEPLQKKVGEGAFREDLYYRLNVIPIQVPPLRERKDDIPLLVGNYLRHKIAPKLGHPVQVTRGAMHALSCYDWPGNVRELENAVERAAILCNPVQFKTLSGKAEECFAIKVSDLPANVQAAFNARIAEGGIATAGFEEPDDLFVLGENTEFFDRASVKAGTPAKIEPLKDFMREQEISYLNRILSQTGGDKEKAASLLGISLATLYRKLAGEETA